MKTREFDPVRSAALRNHLEALPATSARPAAARRTSRLVVAVTVVTAIVLVIAVLGVLRLTAPRSEPAAPAPRLTDPLVSVTTPSSALYVARAVEVVLHARGTGPGTHEFEVPPGVADVTTYIACTPGGTFATTIDAHGGGFSSDCDREAGGSAGSAVTAGRHRLSVRVGSGVDYAVLVIATPAPTVATGALIDPLTAIRDRRTPDALTGDTRPLLRTSGTGSTGTRRFPVPSQRLRVFLVCQPSSTSTRVEIDGHDVTGCMNSVAHWFDLTPSDGRIDARVIAPGTGAWSLLVVPAPAGAADSPAQSLLPFPSTSGTVLAQARGTGAPASGTYARTPDGIELVRSCRGTGWLEVRTADDGSTTSRGVLCSEPWSVGFSGTLDSGGKQGRWTVVPHGDITWTFAITAGG